MADTVEGKCGGFHQENEGPWLTWKGRSWWHESMSLHPVLRGGEVGPSHLDRLPLERRIQSLEEIHHHSLTTKRHPIVHSQPALKDRVMKITPSRGLGSRHSSSSVMGTTTFGARIVAACMPKKVLIAINLTGFCIFSHVFQ
ncbi:hypothetical protein CRG98_016328 [Punica granatum]|uniref:Uncharacterized protein n=1 Tax=Punica granatum TaxID=22663 RepID=A0A2I0K558_PUNGR|nr:hypothetical protein CRG98_016328 [Punica granatum]